MKERMLKLRMHDDCLTAQPFCLVFWVPFMKEAVGEDHWSCNTFRFDFKPTQQNISKIMNNSQNRAKDREYIYITSNQKQTSILIVAIN